MIDIGSFKGYGGPEVEDVTPFWKRKEIIISAVIGVVILLVVPSIILVIVFQEDDKGGDEVPDEIDLSKFVWGIDERTSRGRFYYLWSESLSN